MHNYLLLLMIIYCADNYLQLFVIIDVFGVKKCFFLLFEIICDYL